MVGGHVSSGEYACRFLETGPPMTPGVGGTMHLGLSRAAGLREETERAASFFDRMGFVGASALA